MSVAKWRPLNHIAFSEKQLLVHQTSPNKFPHRQAACKKLSAQLDAPTPSYSVVETIINMLRRGDDIDRRHAIDMVQLCCSADAAEHGVDDGDAAHSLIAGYVLNRVLPVQPTPVVNTLVGLLKLGQPLIGMARLETVLHMLRLTSLAFGQLPEGDLRDLQELLRGLSFWPNPIGSSSALTTELVDEEFSLRTLCLWMQLAKECGMVRDAGAQFRRHDFLRSTWRADELTMKHVTTLSATKLAQFNTVHSARACDVKTYHSLYKHVPAFHCMHPHCTQASPCSCSALFLPRARTVLTPVTALWCQAEMRIRELISDSIRFC
eukprot:6186560-Pleurochrysis_carterae.AAC.2